MRENRVVEGCLDGNCRKKKTETTKYSLYMTLLLRAGRGFEILTRSVNHIDFMVVCYEAAVFRSCSLFRKKCRLVNSW